MENIDEKYELVKFSKSDNRRLVSAIDRFITYRSCYMVTLTTPEYCDYELLDKIFLDFRERVRNSYNKSIFGFYKKEFDEDYRLHFHLYLSLVGEISGIEDRYAIQERTIKLWADYLYCNGVISKNSCDRLIRNSRCFYPRHDIILSPYYDCRFIEMEIDGHLTDERINYLLKTEEHEDKNIQNMKIKGSRSRKYGFINEPKIPTFIKNAA